MGKQSSSRKVIELERFFAGERSDMNPKLHASSASHENFDLPQLLSEAPRPSSRVTSFFAPHFPPRPKCAFLVGSLFLFSFSSISQAQHANFRLRPYGSGNRCLKLSSSGLYPPRLQPPVSQFDQADKRADQRTTECRPPSHPSQKPSQPPECKRPSVEP